MDTERTPDNKIQITLTPEELKNIQSGGTQGLFLDLLSRIESGVITSFEVAGRIYALKNPIILKFSLLDGEGAGWGGHVLAEPEDEKDGLLGWEGVGFPGEKEAADDFRARLGESFKEYALCDPDELTDNGLDLAEKLWDLVDHEKSNRLQAKKRFEEEDGQ